MKPLILVTNDDGVDSPALRAAAEAVLGLGDVLVVAPHVQQSTMSRAFPDHDDVGIIERRDDLLVAGTRCACFAVRGSPACAVAHGVLELASRKPDLCVSGINYGENLGTTVLLSGTVGAALEAASHGIPGIAVSAEVGEGVKDWGADPPRDWEPTINVIRRLARSILGHNLPKDVDILNVNVPLGATLGTEIRTTSQSRQSYFSYVKPERRDFSMPFRLPAKIEIDLATLEPDSDIRAVVIDRVISVTPMGCDYSVRDPTGLPVRMPF
jgi:5'-nucleotidase